MKKLFLLAFLVVLFTPTASAVYGDWDIPDINQEIEISESGTLHITETIVADFTRDEHHGIYREIPYKYRDKYGNPYTLRFHLISVKDEKGKDHNVADLSYYGDLITVKIGDGAVWRDDVVTYVLKYDIDRAVNYFDDHDELYWNVFSDWEVPVIKSTVTVKIPGNSEEKRMQAVCYTGYYGSTSSDCMTDISDGNTFTFTGSAEFMPTEGFTIVAGFPKDIIKRPSALIQLWWFVTDNWPLAIPIATFLFMFTTWWRTGRDPKVQDTIIPRYEPPAGLSPTEVGTIIDERVDVHDISTVVIDYAIKGYLKIKEIKEKKMIFFEETDYEIEIIKAYKSAPGIRSHETEILDSMFGEKSKVNISDLKMKFYKHLEDIKSHVYGNLVKDGFFVHSPDDVRTFYLILGGIFTFGTIFLGGLIFTFFGVTFGLSLIVTGIMFGSFAWIMPKKTVKGAKAYIEIKGLEEYIRTAEKDRIKFQEKENLFFEKLLPYAMVLGLAEKWAGAFKDIYKGKPNWFEAEDMTHFNTYNLVRNLTRFTNSTNTAFASSPRSSGGSSAWGGGSGFSGGFSGGGFGGGGGGGW